VHETEILALYDQFSNMVYRIALSYLRQPQDENGHMLASSQRIPGSFDSDQRPIWLELASEELGTFRHW